MVMHKREEPCKRLECACEVLRNELGNLAQLVDLVYDGKAPIGSLFHVVERLTVLRKHGRIICTHSVLGTTFDVRA